MLLKTVLRMLSALKVYDELFCLPFLREAELFFAAEGISMLERAPPRTFWSSQSSGLPGSVLPSFDTWIPPRASRSLLS